MIIIYLQAISCVLCVFTTIALGYWLRCHPSKITVEKTVAIMHSIGGLAFLLFPIIGLVLYPGLTHYDELLGIPSLPFSSITSLVGLVLLLPGLYFFGMSVMLLSKNGLGLPAFYLSEMVVKEVVYKRCRNPMSLGYYLIFIALGLLAGSTSFTLYSLIVIIPVHIIFLKYFEELELEIRFGQPYLEYKQSVPFLIPNYRKDAGN